MDELRDIQKSDPLARFFDKYPIRTNPFGANQSAERAYRRTERIAAALYLVTNHILPADSLRVAIREGALRLIENMLSLRDEMRATDSAHATACRASIRRLITLIRMLVVAGHVSMQNAHVVTESLDELGNFLSVSQGSPLSESFTLSRENLLDVGGTVKDITDMRGIKDKSIIKDAVNVSDISKDEEGLSVRESGIIGVLRAGVELGIRDIAANLPEYSEKMIQRDLAHLVARAQVKKTGLKRWSRYSLAA